MAGLVQLKATGPQDKFFTDDPEFTFFIENFKKHENFSRFNAELDFDEEPEFDKTVSCTIPQNQGDLIKGVHLSFTLDALPTNYTYSESIGYAMIEHVDISIGGQLIQTITSDMLMIYSELFVTDSKQTSLERLVGKAYTNNIQSNVNALYGGLYTQSQTATKYVVDIPFYFHNRPELALPIYMIDKQEVEISVKFRKCDDVIFYYNSGTVTYSGNKYYGKIKNLKLGVEMITLADKNPRAKIDYRITQFQENIFELDYNENTTEYTCNLTFKNPVKELFFVFKEKPKLNSTELTHKCSVFDYDSYRSTTQENGVDISTNFEILKYLTLTLDSDEVLNEITGDMIHLRAIQPGKHHSRSPVVRRFYTYSFALHPEQHEPSGQLNFSNIRHQTLKVKINLDKEYEGVTDTSILKKELRVYASSYNILRVENGTTKLLFNL